MKTTFFTTLMLVVFAASLYGQSASINNTLGSVGLFTVKDGGQVRPEHFVVAA